MLQAKDSVVIRGGPSDGQVVPILSIEALGELIGRPGLRWADERQWCKRALQGADGPGDCPMYGAEDGQGFCRLNGSERSERARCIFEEPSDASVWRKVWAWRR